MRMQQVLLSLLILIMNNVRAMDSVDPEKPLVLPYLGEVKLELTDNGFEGTLADENKKIELGPLRIDNMKALLTFENKLSITGRALLFEKKASIGLKKHELGTELYILGLTYDQGDKPRLNLIPGAPFTIEASDVELQKDKPVKILAYTKIGQKPITLTLTVQKTQTDLSAETEILNLSDLIPQFKNTPLDVIQLSTVKFEFLDMFNASPKKGFSVSAQVVKADIFPALFVQNAQFTLIVTKGLTDITLDMPTCTIAQVGKITGAKIHSILEQNKKPTITFSGEADVTLGALGKLQVALLGDLQQGVGKITGTLTKPLDFAGFKIPKAVFTYIKDSSGTTLSVEGDTDAYGYKGTFTYTQHISPSGQKKEEIKVTIQEKEIKPLALVPGFGHIAISEPEIDITQKDGKYTGVIKGKYNNELVTFSRTEHEAICTIVSLKLSGLLPNTLIPKELDITLTGIEITVKDLDIPGKKPAASFKATMPLSGPFAPVAALTKATKAELFGDVKQDGKEIVCSAKIPGTMEFGKIVRIDGLKVSFAVMPTTQPVYTIAHTLTFAVPALIKKDALVFDSTLMLVDNQGTLKGTLRGDWQNPFSIQGAKISNTELAARIDFSKKKITDINIEGDISASPAHRFTLQTLGDITSNNYTFVVSLPEELAVTAKQPGLKALDGLAIKNPKLIYSTWKHTEGDVEINEGLNFSGKLQLTGPLAPLAQFIKAKELLVAGVVPQKSDDSFFFILVPSDASAFGAVSVLISSSKGQTDVVASIDNLVLTDLLPQLKATPLNGAQLKKFAFKLIDLFGVTKKKERFGEAQQILFPKPLLPGVQMNDISFRYEETPEATKIACNIQKCSINNVGTVADAHIDATLKPTTPPFIEFAGQLTLHFVELGQIKVQLKSTIQQGTTTVSGHIVDQITFAGISIPEGSFIYDGKAGAPTPLSITGAAQVFGYSGTFSFSKSAAGIVTTKVELADKEIKPFALVPGLQWFVLREPEVTFIKNNTTGDYDAELSGKIQESTMRIIRTPHMLTARVNKATISALLPRLAKTGFDSQWADIELVAQDIDAAGKQPIVTLKGTADLRIFGAGMQGDFTKAEVTVTLNEKTGDLLEAVIAQAAIPGLGVISHAKIKAHVVPNKPADITFTGELALQFEGMDPIRVLIDSRQQDGTFVIAGTLVQDITFAGFTVTQGQFSFDSKDKSILVAGTTDVYGNKGTFTVRRSAGNEIQVEIKFDAHEIHPFSMVPAFKDITLSSPFVEIKKDEKRAWQATLKGAINGAAVAINRAPTAIACQFERLTLAQIFSVIKMSGLAGLELANATFSITDLNTQGKTPTTLLAGTMRMTGPFEPVAQLTGVQEAIFNGSIAQGGKEVSCSARIPNDMIFGSVAKLTDIRLQFSVTPQTATPTLVLTNQLTLRLPTEKEPLIFDTNLTIAGTTGSLAGTLKGDWHDPLGIKGLILKKPRIAATVDSKTKVLTDISIEETETKKVSANAKRKHRHSKHRVLLAHAT